MLRGLASIGAVVAIALAAGAPAEAVGRCGSHPWCDPSLSPDARAGLLLNALTEDEKISLLAGDDLQGGFTSGDNIHTGTSDGVPRVDLPTTYYSDGPLGPRQGKATAMPAPMGLAATFDPRLAYTYGSVVANEVKDKGNDVVFAPTVNIVRTPLWGRTFETFGEDPYLTSHVAVDWIRGAQSQGVIANVKHFAANNQEGVSPTANQGGPGSSLGLPGPQNSRYIVNAVVDQRTLREIYLPAFEAAVKLGHVGSIMCSYNRLNGQFACQNEQLLHQILEREWGFKGYVLADYGAAHPDGTINSLNDGLDFEPWPGMSYSPNQVKLALASSQVSPAAVDEHVRRILRTAFAFGFFDRPAFKDDDAQIDKAAHARDAQRVEEQAITLLKNDGVLPLDPAKDRSIAVIGTQANKFVTGGGSGDVTPFDFKAPLDAIRARAGSGVEVNYDDGSDAARAAGVAKAADVALVFVGDYQTEGNDRACLSLECPDYNGDQDGLIDAVAAAQPNTVVVMETGGPDLTPWRGQIKGLVEAWYPGEQAGPAIARVLFGDVDPGGRLPATFPQSEDQLPTAGDPDKYPGDSQQNVYYKEGVLVGYRWYDAKNLTPAYPFGFGLSYTTFAFTKLRVSTDVGGTPPVSVSVRVTNTGGRAGYAVPQLYVGMPQPAPSVVEPPKQLKGIAKVLLQPGQTKTVRYTLDQRAFSYWDVDSDGWKVAPGCFSVMVGSSSRDITNTAVVSHEASCSGVAARLHVGACKRSVLIHLRHVRGHIRRVIAYVGRHRSVFGEPRDAVRVVIGGAKRITTVRLVVRTSRGTVRMTRRFHTCVR